MQCQDNCATTGSFVLPVDRGKVLAFHPQELAALFIAELLGGLKTLIGGHEELRQASSCALNMAAPLDMLNKPDLEMVFNTVLYCASLIKGEVYQGMPVTKAKQVASEALTALEQHGLPGEDVRSTFLIPETHAAMVGYMMSGKAETGNYAAIDVGAGTTDVAVFRICDPRYGERDFAYYHAGTDLTGGDEMDVRILRVLGNGVSAGSERQSRMLAAIRHAKACFNEETGIVVEGKRLGLEQIDWSIRPVVDQILTHYRRIWGLAYTKDMNLPRWKNMGVVVLGGGVRNTRS